VDSHSVAGLAERVLAQAPSRFALAGLSMGGIVAMEIIRRAPERVTHLALLDTNPLVESDEMKATRGPQIEQATSGDLKVVLRDEMKPRYLTDGPRRNQILDLCLDMGLGLGKEVFLKQSQALMTRRDQTETLKAFNKPTLVLCGEDDTLCPPERHQLMHDLLPDSHLSIIPGAGHLPTLEQPDATNTQLLRWLERE
jgi:pimeloyl-ACP methyl ester carboxylesterase